jgi:hypothetical protein
MMRLSLACLIDSRIRIVARSSKIPDVPEQMPVRILHPQVAELRANRKKNLRRLPPGPTFGRQPSYQHKPTPIHHLIEYSLQPRSSNLGCVDMLYPIIAAREILAIPRRAIFNRRWQGGSGSTHIVILPIYNTFF